MKYLRNDNSEIEFKTILESGVNEATSFRHFKGHIYKIVCIAKDVDSLKDYVIYQSQDEKKVWSREISEFFSKVDKEKYPTIEQIRRFEKI